MNALMILQAVAETTVPAWYLLAAAAISLAAAAISPAAILLQNKANNRRDDQIRKESIRHALEDYWRAERSDAHVQFYKATLDARREINLLCIALLKADSAKGADILRRNAKKFAEDLDKYREHWARTAVVAAPRTEERAKEVYDSAYPLLNSVVNESLEGKQREDLPKLDRALREYLKAARKEIGTDRFDD